MALLSLDVFFLPFSLISARLTQHLACLPRFVCGAFGEKRRDSQLVSSEPREEAAWHHRVCQFGWAHHHLISLAKSTKQGMQRAVRYVAYTLVFLWCSFSRQVALFATPSVLCMRSATCPVTRPGLAIWSVFPSFSSTCRCGVSFPPTRHPPPTLNPATDEVRTTIGCELVTHTGVATPRPFGFNTLPRLEMDASGVLQWGQGSCRAGPCLDSLEEQAETAPSMRNSHVGRASCTAKSVPVSSHSLLTGPLTALQSKTIPFRLRTFRHFLSSVVDARMSLFGRLCEAQLFLNPFLLLSPPWLCLRYNRDFSAKPFRCSYRNV
eukprot:TRINITY_DN5710_c1_g2_i1.p1 TRINITY_DN5710_c1_g2~~TRINITY_DN5710_c1_g2_i1.p1  ORF type:complete len:322 (+),score=-68.25 TRINITY_DN5710_c1_g2_i1:272-1237(+)